MGAADCVVATIRHPDIEGAWDRDSALPKYTIGGLTGHLARAVLAPADYLQRPEPLGAAPVGPAEYFLQAAGDADPVESTEHQQVRARAGAEAEDGPQRLARRVERAAGDLRTKLNTLPEATVIEVFGTMAMRLDDYLITRVVEIVVHLDDLEASVHVDLPALPPGALDLTLATLFEIATARHGPKEMLRALARRERSETYPRAF